MKLKSMIQTMICLGLHNSLFKCNVRYMVGVVMVMETLQMKNYRLLLKKAFDLADMSGNRTVDFDDFVIGIMESDEEGDKEVDSDTDDDQLLIADLEKPVASSPKMIMPSSLAVSTVSCQFFFIIFSIILSGLNLM